MQRPPKPCLTEKLWICQTHFVIIIVIIIIVVVVIIIVASIIIIILDIAQNFKKSYQTQQCAEILWANQECHIQKIFFV